MSYTPGQRITYPWLVMHKDHIAFRMKNQDPTRPDEVLLPNGDNASEFVACGTCDRKMGVVALLTKQWRVIYKLT